jgi:hypothetical protein
MEIKGEKEKKWIEDLTKENHKGKLYIIISYIK